MKKPHQHERNFIRNNLQLLCSCEFIADINQQVCTFEDFKKYSSNQIKQHVKFFRRIYRNFKSKKKQKNQINVLNEISSLIYDLKTLQSQLENNNIQICLELKFMQYFKYFEVDQHNNFRIISNFHKYIMKDLIKIIQSYQMEQCNIQMICNLDNIKIIYINTDNQQIKIKETFQNYQQYYLELNLYQKYGFTLQIGNQSLIQMLQKYLWDKIKKKIMKLWKKYQIYGEEVLKNWVITDLNQSYLFRHKKQIVEDKILSSIIVQETFNGQNEIDFQQRDYNDLKKKKILLNVMNSLSEYKDQIFIQNAITQIIGNKINQNFCHFEELTQTQLLQPQISNQINNYEQSINSQLSNNREQTNNREQSNNSLLIQQLNQMPPQNNQAQDYQQYKTQALLQFFYENQPNFQNHCHNFAIIQWKIINLMNDLENFQELTSLKDLIDLETQQITQY